jgi:hypothetical protein
MLNDDGLHLIHKAMSFGDKSVSGTGSIPVITSARASPFFSWKAKALMCLKCIDCNYLEFRNQERNTDSSNSPQIFHPNIRRLQSKTDKLRNYLEI